MARSFPGATSSYLSITDSLGLNGTGPLTLATWFNLDTLAINNYLVTVGLGESADFRLIYVDVTSGTVRAWARNGGASGTAVHGSTAGTGAWTHLCGVFGSTTSRLVYLNGVTSSEDTTAVTPSTPTKAKLGVNQEVASTFDGMLAETGIWNVVLDADEVAALAKGFSPVLIRPQSLVAYWPLVGNDSPELDRWKNRYDLTLTGTPTKADHPRVYMPTHAQVGIYAPPAATGTGRMFQVFG